MNGISDDVISEVTVELLRQAVTSLPNDIRDGLRKAYEAEDDSIPKMQLKNILDNIDIAEETRLPMCQDTGVQIFFVTFGKGLAVDVSAAITEGVKKATEAVPLRPNAVHPLSRNNPGDNTGLFMPYINYDFSDEDYIEISVMPKGAGSENMSALRMLPPASGLKGIKEFVLDTVVAAGGKPCPPTIIGLGIGGSADISLKLAKKSLLRPIDVSNAEPEMATLENDMYEAVNAVGIGPMGLGGKTTVLGVNIEYAFCHTASLPAAINLQCWAARRATARIHPDERIEYITHKKEGGA
jgi:fumarate hydratase subunit alpha